LKLEWDEIYTPNFVDKIDLFLSKFEPRSTTAYETVLRKTIFEWTNQLQCFFNDFYGYGVKPSEFVFDDTLNNNRRKVKFLKF
jgi:hypothetical protein